MDLARKAEHDKGLTESHLRYAAMFCSEAEASETDLNFTDAAWWRRGAAILYGMAGQLTRSKEEWKNAAEMFDMAVRSYYRERTKEGYLSKGELSDLIDDANEILICCSNMEFFGPEGRKLLERYSTLYSLAKKAIRGSHAERPEPMLMES